MLPVSFLLIAPLAQTPLGGSAEALRVHPGAVNSDHGSSARALGDVDGDGIRDYGIGSPNEEQTLYRQGVVRVHSGADGSVLHEIVGPNEWSQYGSRVFDAGDLNGDGFADFGYRHSDSGRTVRILSGADGGLLLELVQPPLPNGSTAFETFFGTDLACVGDLDADGIPDYAVGASGYNHLGVYNVGILFTMSGADGSVLDFHIGTQRHGYLGASVEAAGDLNLDGTPDILASAPTDAFALLAGGPGEVFAFSGLGLDILYSMEAPVDCSLGQSLSSGPDVTGDGIPDFAAGCAGSRSLSTTWVVVFSGADGSVHWYQEIATSYGGGNNVSFGEDFDGDGLGDLAMFESGYPTASDNGRLTVFSLATGEPWIVAVGQPEWQEWLGSISVLDDLDGDGIPEVLLAGAQGSSPAVTVLSLRDHLRLGVDSISASAGGTVDLEIDFGTAAAGDAYQVLASLAGPSPYATIGGVNVPLGSGAGLGLTKAGNYPSYFLNGIGLLDATGTATATLDASPGALPPSLIGVELHFAVLQGDAMAASACSLRRSLRIEP